MAVPTSQGARRPHRPRVASDPAPPTVRPITPVTAQIIVNSAILPIFPFGSIASTCIGTRIC